MSQFETTLRAQVDDSLKALSQARRAGLDYEVHLHGARVQELLDMASEHGIDTASWVDPMLLEAAALR